MQTNALLASAFRPAQDQTHEMMQFKFRMGVPISINPSEKILHRRAHSQPNLDSSSLRRPSQVSLDCV